YYSLSSQDLRKKHPRGGPGFHAALPRKVVRSARRFRLWATFSPKLLLEILPRAIRASSARGGSCHLGDLLLLSPRRAGAAKAGGFFARSPPSLHQRVIAPA